jgi:NAD(P)-dependent dehydrogenase (short-subunit alcohol dehydrogenase family)
MHARVAGSVSPRALWRLALLGTLVGGARTGSAQVTASPLDLSGRTALVTASPLDLRGHTALVTGSTDGLGREVARTLARAGARVIVHGRSAERGAAVVAEITAAGGSAQFVAADFASLDAVRAFADSVARLAPRLDLLVSNAGVWVPAGEGRRTSADGHELHFAVNYLAGWVLLHRLAPPLAAAPSARVISVASIAQSPIDWDDVMLTRPGASARGYGQSKLAQITMTVALAPEFAARGITLVALHPATMMNTTMVQQSGMPARTTVQEGHDAVMALVRAPTLEPGAYYNGTRRAAPHAQALDPEAQRRLRALSARLAGVP